MPLAFKKLVVEKSGRGYRPGRLLQQVVNELTKAICPRSRSVIELA